MGATVSAAYDPGLKLHFVADRARDLLHEPAHHVRVGRPLGAVEYGGLQDVQRPAEAGAEHRVLLRLPRELVLDGREGLHPGLHRHGQRRRAQPRRRLVYYRGCRGGGNGNGGGGNGNGGGGGTATAVGNGSAEQRQRRERRRRHTARHSTQQSGSGGSGSSGTGCSTGTTGSSSTQSANSGRVRQRRAGHPATRRVTPAPRARTSAPARDGRHGTIDRHRLHRGPAPTRPSDTITTFGGGGYSGSTSGQTTGQQGSQTTQRSRARRAPVPAAPPSRSTRGRSAATPTPSCAGAPPEEAACDTGGTRLLTPAHRERRRHARHQGRRGDPGRGAEPATAGGTRQAAAEVAPETSCGRGGNRPPDPANARPAPLRERM